MRNQTFYKKSVSSLLYLFFISSLIVILASCDFGPPKNSRPAQASRGELIFNKQCLSCHGLNEIKATVDTLEKMAPDLTKISKRRHTSKFPVVEIAKYIDGRQFVKEHGVREMPVWGEVYADEGLGEEEIRGRKGELVAFLMSIQKL